MRLALMTLLFVQAAAAFSGCASTKSHDKGDDLDVAMNAQADAEKPSYDDVVPAKNSEHPPIKLAKTAVMNWREFFKAPPTQKEKNLLEQRLDKWVDAGTVKDLVAKGRDEVAIGRMVAAETSFRKALRLKGDDLEAELELASLFLRKKAVTEAFDLLSQARDTIGTSDAIGQSTIFRYRYTLALAYFARGDRSKGHKVLSDLIGIDKGFAPAYTSLAASYLALGKDSVAEFVIRRGLDRASDNAALLNLMGVISQKNRQLEAARSWYDKALGATPGFAPALVNRASLSALTLEYGAAEEDLLQALSFDPQNVDALVTLGVVQKRQGNTSGARASFAKAVDIDADNAFARFNLAVLYADELKKPNEAMRLFTEVMQTTLPGSELREMARSYINDLKATGQAY